MVNLSVRKTYPFRESLKGLYGSIFGPVLSSMRSASVLMDAFVPRANRYLVPGSIHHPTGRCHDRDFLLKFAVRAKGIDEFRSFSAVAPAMVHALREALPAGIVVVSPDGGRFKMATDFASQSVFVLPAVAGVA